MKLRLHHDYRDSEDAGWVRVLRCKRTRLRTTACVTISFFLPTAA